MINYDKFKNITGYDVRSFFQSFSDFVAKDFQFIASYYNGGNLNKDAFFKLGKLEIESKKIEPLFDMHKGKLNTSDMWDILDAYSDIQIELETFRRFGKWSRSSRLGTQDASVKIQSTLKQGEYFEDVATKLGYSDPQNSWVDLAIRNGIAEEDYTKDGGTLFSISLSSSSNFDIPNIIDYFTPNNVYGKDLTRTVEFKNNDLATITGKENLTQNFEVKLTTFKRSIPEFPESGIDGSLLGGSGAAFQYPSIMRDVIAMFKKDSRWGEVNVINLKRDQDAIFIQIECKSILSEGFIKNLTL